MSSFQSAIATYARLKDDNKPQGNDDDNKVEGFEFEPEVVKTMREFVLINRGTSSYEYRIKELLQIKKGLEALWEDIMQAAKKDLGRHPAETAGSDILTVVKEIDYAVKNLKTWMQPSREWSDALMTPSAAYTLSQPKGVVLVIGPWNVPFNLTIVPVVNAIAAGNSVVVKPSEISSNCALVIQKLFKTYSDPKLVKVFLGGVPETTILLKERWDHIFFTGNSIVGRIIYTAAAKHLTPCTLELGGKSPVYIHKDANIEMSVERILTVKLTNAGQVCLTPDYLLVHRSIVDKFNKALIAKLKKMFGPEPIKNDSFARLVNVNHYDRVIRMLQENHGGDVLFGGLEQTNRDEKFICLTVVSSPKLDSIMMQEEIFGPILPVLSVQDEHEAISRISAKDQPLALYVFTEDSHVADFLIENTSAGGSTVNDCLFHVGISALPFGGIGESGIGSYHGKAGFDEFSHRRAVLYRHSREIIPRSFPYNPNMVPILRKIAFGGFLPKNPIAYLCLMLVFLILGLVFLPFGILLGLFGLLAIPFLTQNRYI